MNKILDTTKVVVENSTQVKLDKDKVKEFSASFNHKDVQHWLNAAPFGFDKMTDIEKLNFLLVFNSISFRYWGNPKWTVEYQGEKHDGSWAMVVCIRRAIDEDKPILDAKYRADFSREVFADILRGSIEIPLLDERFNITKEIASTLERKYDGQFGRIIELAEGDALKLLELVISNFPSFADVTRYKDKDVFFYKRAQLLVADIHQIFDGKGYGNLKNVEEITACADYKLPQILRGFGILKYSASLAEKIDQKVSIQKDSKEEIEIRANTIWAVELIKEALQKQGKNYSSFEINDHIWLLSQDKSHGFGPYHLTETSSY